jgi:hypothetical protein
MTGEAHTNIIYSEYRPVGRPTGAASAKAQVP